MVCLMFVESKAVVYPNLRARVYESWRYAEVMLMLPMLGIMCYLYFAIMTILNSD